MAQHLNPNQVQHLGMLQGLNFTILNQQPSHLGQAFGQQDHQGMYQIVQQVQPGQHQVQLQNVQQFNNQFHHMQPQQFNSQQQILLQQQLPQQVQQIQQQTHQQIQHQPVQQQQIQSNNTPSNKGNKNKNNNNNNDNQEITKSGKKKKKAPVPNKDGVLPPKRATTAYINFTQFYREEIKKSGRTVPKIGEFGKECAAKWNSMTDEEKKPFTSEAEKDRERYRKEMEIFKPQRDKDKPKRPGTAFMLFMVDFRKEIAGKEPEGGVAALAKLGGERWRSMTDEHKKPYVEQQNVCKVLYEQKMEDYRKLTGQPATGGGKASNNNTSKANSTSVKSEDSNASEHLNNSMSNSNISTLKK